ncbi:hypothetical protein B0T13DRAFT_447718 [Neurospora crassa]|nr:hypothetical protein B0T13DRAFT_447718 [Neurospora crassa]
MQGSGTWKNHGHDPEEDGCTGVRTGLCILAKSEMRTCVDLVIAIGQWCHFKVRIIRRSLHSSYSIAADFVENILGTARRCHAATGCVTSSRNAVDIEVVPQRPDLVFTLPGYIVPREPHKES